MPDKPETLLRLPAVKARVGLSKTTIYKLMRKQEFPAQLDLGARAVAWRETMIENWVAKRQERLIGKRPGKQTATA